MSITEASAGDIIEVSAGDIAASPASMWPDSAGHLPFSLQRYRGGTVAAPLDDEARLFPTYTAAARGAGSDEAVGVVGGEMVCNPLYAQVVQRLEDLGGEELRARATRRDRFLLSDGVTFGGAEDMPRRPFPIDLVPRLLPAAEWAALTRGVEQRTAALDAFLADVHGEQRIVRAGVVPAALIQTVSSRQGPGRPGAEPSSDLASGGRRAVVVGTDLLRDRSGRWLVVEDDVRSPSGIGYAMQARRALATVLPELTPDSARRAVSHASSLLRKALEAAAPVPSGAEPAVAVLSSGPRQSAWFEHRMLASAMKAPLVLARDLIAVGDRIAIMRPDGPRRIDVLYRRHSEATLATARSATGDLLLPQLMHAVRSGCLRLVNPIGNGVADDRAVLPYVPAMIRYYLGEQPLLDNVPTHVLSDPACARNVLADLTRFVVKPVDGRGPAGVVLGPDASGAELDRLRTELQQHPERYVAQELVDSTTHPTLVGSRLEPRQIDLRVFTVAAPEPQVLPTPLTRVALPKGSMLVDSIGGGGAKDTWIVD
jgi:carboxylate-amine ligase